MKKKTAFWTIFLSAPNAPPPRKTTSFIFIVVSPSLRISVAGTPGLKTQWVLRQTRWVQRRTQWVHLQTRGRKGLTEFSPQRSVRAQNLTELGLRDRIRPVSDHSQKVSNRQGYMGFATEWQEMLSHLGALDIHMYLLFWCLLVPLQNRVPR